MRKFEFRVFSNGKMIYFKNSGYEMSTLFFTVHPWNDTGSCGEGYRLNDVCIMQYVGMKDCKGNKIFEGDTLMVDGSFKANVVYSDRWGSFEVSCTGNSVGWYGSNRLEVIGNIHEDKE